MNVSCSVCKMVNNLNQSENGNVSQISEGTNKEGFGLMRSFLSRILN